MPWSRNAGPINIKSISAWSWDRMLSSVHYIPMESEAWQSSSGYKTLLWELGKKRPAMRTSFWLVLLLMYFISKNFWFTIHVDSWFRRIIDRICLACAIFRWIPNLQACTDRQTDRQTDRRTDRQINPGWAGWILCTCVCNVTFARFLVDSLKNNGAFLKTQRHKNINYDTLKYIFCVLS